MVRPDLHLPPSFVAWLAPFLAAFSRRSRPTTAALAVGALLAVGPRTVTNCLRTLGLAEHPSFTAFHRVLNRNVWSGLALARTLLGMVVATFVPAGPVIIGLDHTLERRRGPRIGPAQRFYDASLRADVPKPASRGLRWLSAMVLVDVPFAGRIWGLPVLTALTPSKAWSEQHGRRHRPVTEWARRLLLTLRRWLPVRRRRHGWRVRRPGSAARAARIRGGHHLDAQRCAAVQSAVQPRGQAWPAHPQGHATTPAVRARHRPALALPRRDVSEADRATPWQRVVQASRTSWRSSG